MDIVWIGLAFLLGLLLNKYHIPPLVGYLLAGLALSFTSYEPGYMLHELAHLGVIFLLFTVGLHISLKNILQREVLGVGLIHLLISSAIFIPVSLYFGLSLEASIIVAITLGFSSTVLAAKGLEIRNELGSFYGRLSIGILIVQDLVAIGIIAYAGGGVPSPWAVILLGLPLIRPILSRLLYIVEREELLLLMALSLAVGGSALFELVNLSGELGALVMGMLLVNDDKADQLEKKIWGIKEAFLVGFFLEIGLGGLPGADGFYYIGVLLLLLPLKAALFFGLFIAFRLRARTGFLSTVTLTAYSEFTLIAGAVAAAAGIIPAELIVVLGLLTAISYVINSVLMRYEDTIWQRFNTFLRKYERNVKHPDHQPVSLGAAKYLVIGLGKTGQAALKLFKDKGQSAVGIDINPDRVKAMMNEGCRVLYADAQDAFFWEELDMPKLRNILLAMSGDIYTKVFIVEQLRKKNYLGAIHVLTQNEYEDELIRNAGGDPVSVPSVQMGEKMAQISMEAV
ncbi:MAG: potassium transporter KefC [Balneolaceae bacterium]|nr:MAG: potassium transporter KefC [Balneolaceae bacterium]